MLTKEKMVEALDFLRKASGAYRSNKETTANLMRNYMMGHKDLDIFLMNKDLVYSGFRKFNWIEADFDSAIRVLRNEIENS